ncbi:MAG: tetratricopeptide repeat protein, partial [Vicinamibacteria bacterium]
MNRLDDRVTSLEMVQEVAERAGAEIVLLGSFMKAGETIRINLRVQEAASGKILASEKIEGPGEASLFPMVDTLTERILAKLDVPGPALDRGLEEVTTSSVEAYRYYSEGMNLHYQVKETEAVPLFERAIEIDPGFAMALARLALIHYNLGHEKESLEYGSRAVAQADRLPSHEKSYVEGFYYSLRQNTWNRTVETYEKALEEYPEHESIRNNLAFRYWYLELNQKAVEHAERLRRAGTDFPGTYFILSGAHAALGRFEEGEQALKEFLSRNPDSAVGYRYLGFHYLHQEKLDEAREAFSRETSLSPASLWPAVGLWEMAILREDREGARFSATKLAESSSPF